MYLRSILSIWCLAIGLARSALAAAMEEANAVQHVCGVDGEAGKVEELSKHTQSCFPWGRRNISQPGSSRLKPRVHEPPPPGHLAADITRCPDCKSSIFPMMRQRLEHAEFITDHAGTPAHLKRVYLDGVRYKYCPTCNHATTLYQKLDGYYVIIDHHALLRELQPESDAQSAQLKDQVPDTIGLAPEWKGEIELDPPQPNNQVSDTIGLAPEWKGEIELDPTQPKDQLPDTIGLAPKWKEEIGGNLVRTEDQISGTKDLAPQVESEIEVVHERR
ncbi:hypothetical protein PSTG_06702 [Puccinia striiformis f. sp. tritici PST-78]|uniref:C2H2-type domain-containing protein n=1 Tax=Puccinia striiformis f. sp. tritici PST-78 TaxID=1165861 RepID=A0A0L0VLD9_9BASI|nr:hypothetical protein PSTG_06702 [Puccinia striiformis f. sp. tritici PST-78]